MRVAAEPSAGIRGLVVASAVLAVALAGHPHRVAVRVQPRDAAERAAIIERSLDVWSEDPLVVVVPATQAAGEIVVDDVDAVAAGERARLAPRAEVADFFAEYRDLDEVNAYVDGLVARYPELARTRSIGTSIEGRDIRVLDLGLGSGSGSTRIAINGGQHAREWISVMVPLCVADRLLGRRPDLLAHVGFSIVPVANPDGYAYSWTHDRYWRKNRHGGYGVDLNRNYSVGWGEAGSSDRPRSPNYRGEAPFSEPESRAMQALFADGSFAAHIDFHSYSQVIVYPWSHKRAEPADRDRFAALADRMASALFAAHGERYAIRPGSELTVGAGGTLGDWAYGEHGALSFLVELRPSSRRGGGFVLPPDQIAPTCDESFAAVVALAESLLPAASPAHLISGTCVP